MRDVARIVLVGWICLSLLPGCAYYHPVIPQPPDPADLPAGIREDVEVGSLVRVKMKSGQWVSGEVLRVTDEQLVVRVGSMAAPEVRTFEIDDIEDLKVKTWETADTVIFTGLGIIAVFVAWVIANARAWQGFAGD